MPHYSTGHYKTTYTLSVEDRLEIVDLCHKFDHILNLGHQEKLGDLFAPDAQVGGHLQQQQQQQQCLFASSSGIMLLL